MGLVVRADEAVAVWVNGQRAHADREGRVRSITDAPDEILATLHAGWNEVLTKVVNVIPRKEHAQENQK